VGKTYFGAVALQLVAEGRIRLDDRLSRYLGDEPWYPRLPNGAEVTIRQLMSHTSGIVRYEFNPAFLEDLRAEPMRTFSPTQRLDYLFGFDPPFAAGEGWEYSDTNFILLAMVIEDVTGAAAYDEIQRRLLDPLGLSETIRSDAPSVYGLVNGYAGSQNPFGVFDATMEHGRLVFNPQFEWGGGGFASTAGDLAEWTRHVHEGRAFDETLLDEMHQGTPAPLGPEASYGLGVIMMQLSHGTAWGHSGFMPGYRTEAYYFPEHGFAIAVQINTTDNSVLTRSPLRILDELAGRIITDLEERS
jgi:D-alanyl-D-alanine carboxypeptidase